MIFYLTFNDLPSGIFSSQVIDVVHFLRQELKADIRLVSFISLRNFSYNKKKIREKCPDAIVLPMVPGIHRWRRNALLLRMVCKRYKPETIIGRSVMAARLALMMKRSGNTSRVVYDGRGAIAAEWKEYGVITNPVMLKEIDTDEREVVLQADFRIAVSEQLVKHWENSFAYRRGAEVVIPCTLNKVFGDVEITKDHIAPIRTKLALAEGDVLFAYSGSLAGWQSFDLLHGFIRPLFEQRTNVKLLFLSEKNDLIEKLQSEFGDRILCHHVSPNEVPAWLLAADYGLLIREETITNKVASPVKFAEYLACGLKVIISDNLGDYTAYVQQFDCGYLFTNIKGELSNVSIEKKQVLNKMAVSYFSKSAYKKQYEQLIQ